MTTPALSPLFADHSDLGTLNQAVGLNAPLGASNVQQQQQQFWATVPREQASPTQEVLDIALPSARMVNVVSFDVARYPHVATLQYSGLDGVWRPMLSTNGTPASATILQSVPAVLPKITSVPGHLHPQHAFASHWETLSFVLQPVSALRVRVVLQRTPDGHGPVNGFGQSVNYSLAVMNFQLGYRVASLDDIPRTGMQSATTRQPIATTDDLLGSSVDYALRVNKAANIIDNTSGDAALVWKSQPQPMPSAVVNFYADMRDVNGLPQIIDQIFIDPINNGAHITVYYSNDNPVGGFDASAEPLGPNQAVLQGAAAINQPSLHLGNYSQAADVLIANTSVGFDPSLPWWVGLRFTTNFAQGADANEHVLFDCSAFRVSVTATGVSLITAGGDSVNLVLSYGGGQNFSVIAAYDQQYLYLRARTATDDISYSTPVTVPIPTGDYPSLALGATVTGTKNAYVELLDFVLKEEVRESDDFLDEPDVYSSVAQFNGGDAIQSRNALLRLDVFNQLTPSAAPAGLFGGPGVKFDQMVWTPIPRDYTMQRGWMFLPTTQANFINLEITNLPANYQEIYIPTPQVVRLFPPSVLGVFENEATSRVSLPEELGLSVLAGLTSNTPYSDFPIYVSTGGTQKGYTNTEVYVAEDYTTAQRLYAKNGQNWAYQNWHGGSSAPRWTSICQHAYIEQLVTSISKIGYGVGLRQIAFARTVFTAQDDVGAYQDALFDQHNLVSSNWIYDPDKDALFSGDAAKAQAISVIFGSNRQVRGLQFAAQQSQPQQLLADPDFADPYHRNWTFVGDAVASPAEVLPWIGTVLPVTRNLAVGYWGDIAALEHTWGALRLSGKTYGDFTSSSRTGQNLGGVASTPFIQPIGGRIYAAARVVADRDLDQPLAVQIVDSVTGTVLAQATSPVKRDQITEWYTSYDVGQGGGWVGNTWGSLYHSTGSLPSFTDGFVRANANVLGNMDSGQAWIAGAGGSLHIAGNHATVTSVGQSNSIDTQSPWGALTVTLGTFISAGSAPASVPLIDLGGILVMNDGRVIDTNTQFAYTTLTMASNDVFKFDFVPTKNLISGQRPGGVSNSVTPWSIAISRNGSWVLTIPLATAFKTVRALSGASGQIFTAFAWAPRYATNPIDASTIYKLPMPSDGASTVISSLTNSWLDGEGHTWTYTNNWTFATGVSYQGSINSGTVTPGTAVAAGGATIITDVGDQFGTIEFSITQLENAGSSDPVFFLDAGTHVLAIDSRGRITTGAGVPLTGVIIPTLTAGPIQIRYMRPSWLEPTLRTTYGVSPTLPQVLVIMQSNVILGMYAGTGLWTSTLRGYAGGSDGLGGGGNHTVVAGFSFSPEASQVVGNTQAVTWGDVDGNDTLTYADLEGHSILNSNSLVARVVQLAPSTDSWLMDDLSVFFDPIVWEFSNDGGATWMPGYEIRNNPQGVILFPPPPANPTGTIQQTQLQWRATAWGPNCWISHLTIRPWYQGLMRGIPARASFTPQGPNINPYDHYPPIEQDPHFQVWHSPIPRDWYFAYRSLVLATSQDSTNQWTDIIVGDAITSPE